MERMELPEIVKYRLKKNYNSVLKDLEPRKILGYLYQEGVFDEDDMDEVRDERTRKRQAEALLSMLSRRDVQGYNVLVMALSEAQPHLAKLLQTPIPDEETRGKEPGNGSPKYEDIMGMMQELQVHGNPTENYVNAPPPAGVYISGSFDRESGSSTGYPTTTQQNSTDFVKSTNLDLISQLYRPYLLESVYKMTSSPRGLAIIVNNDNFVSDSTVTGEKLDKREGSKVDEKALVDLFTALDFKTKTLVDLDEDELLTSLEKISKSDFSGYDCFVLCIMSHGKDGFFYASDGGKITIKTVLQKFNNAHCKTLCGKPKLYFVQACRGKFSDSGTIVKDGPSGNPTEHEEPQKPPKMPQFAFEMKRAKRSTTGEHADQLVVAFSSVEGYSSYQNTSSGSRFIQSLVEVFREYARVEDVESMMTRVIRKVNSQGDLGSKQVPKPETTLTKKVFFWPGMKF